MVDREKTQEEYGRDKRLQVEQIDFLRASNQI